MYILLRGIFNVILNNLVVMFYDDGMEWRLFLK